MVLTQPWVKKEERMAQISFHTTMVLTQLTQKIGTTAASYSFPYHYGSYATR